MCEFISWFSIYDADNGREILLNLSDIAIVSEHKLTTPDNSIMYYLQIILHNEREFRILGKLEEFKSKISIPSGLRQHTKIIQLT